MKNLSKYRYQIALFFLLAILFLTNYKPGTYLLGWDNLQTELNPALGVKRAIFSVWEEYQSFGLLAGMAHATDLVRALFIFFLSFILPQNLIRYFYHFLMLFLGGLGMLKLLKGGKAAFLGTLFYILNLGTIQIFYLPFEPFSTFFAFLPWGIWSFMSITYNVKRVTYKRDLFWFFLINLLGTPSFYTQQLFVVYLLILGLISLGKILRDFSTPLEMTDRKILKNIIIAFGLIFIINSFWILPQLYFVKTSSSVVYNAKINQLATEDVYFQNREKGTLKYFLRHEGYYYDLFDKNNQLLFLPWKKHFQTFYPLQYLFAFLMVLGLIIAIKRRKWELILPFTLIVIVFLNATWPISLLDQTIRSNRFLNQIFRSPFTKFIIPYSLFASYFIFLAVVFIKNFIYKSIQRKTFINLFYLAIILSIFIYALPAFSGSYFASEMKVKIPKEYFSLIDYFKKEDKNKRIALFPEYTFWGWYIARWGLNGSGFLWYGIEQPIVSRTFDVWSEKSEGYFWEIKAAIEAEDIQAFENVAQKYNIDYFLLDKSLKPVTPTSEIILYDRLQTMLSKSKIVKEIKSFGELTIYSVDQPNTVQSFVNLTNNLPNIRPAVKAMFNDVAFSEYRSYVTNDNKMTDVYYPLRDLQSQTQRNKGGEWEIRIENENIVVSSKIPKSILQGNYTLNIPDIADEQILEDDEVITIPNKVDVSVDTNILNISFPKLIIQKFNLQSAALGSCGPSLGISEVSNYDPAEFTLTSEDGSTGCIGYATEPTLPQSLGYILEIKNSNIKGRRLFMYVLDNTKKEAFIEDRLQKNDEIYVLPPRYEWGQGYSINFHNNSHVGMVSQNTLKSLVLYYMPYDVLSRIKFVRSGFENKDTSTHKTLQDSYDAEKINYYTYKVGLQMNDTSATDNLLILDQSYHEGWVAYETDNTWFPFFGHKLEDHVIVNNWANGWRLEKSSDVSSQSSVGTKCLDSDNCPLSTVHYVIVFWPQYLEYLGFVILGITLSILLLLTFKQYRSKNA